MTKITAASSSLTSPVWAGDFFDRAHMVVGGSQVVAADFTADAQGRKPIPSGTVVGRTYAERDAGTGFGPAADSDDEILIVAFDVTNAIDLTDVELYRPGSMVKENLLPDWDILSAAVKASLRAKYQTIKGVV